MVTLFGWNLQGKMVKCEYIKIENNDQVDMQERLTLE